jgi:iron-sulfur cluster assembly protein
MAVHISEKAKAELVKLGVGSDRFLRISVVAGGCSGHTYSAGVDSTLKENDQVVFNETDFRAIADAESARYLDGLEIDYSDDLIQSGFQFRNPNAVKACGCGSSFKV